MLAHFFKRGTKGEGLDAKSVTVTNLSTFHPFNHSTNYPSRLTPHSSRKCAFTLAEVLITLGIIGVVAALVIPNLISNYEKKVIETGLAKTYSELATWIQKAENDFGPISGWEAFQHGGDLLAKKYAMPYMDLKRCNWHGYYGHKCFAKAYTTRVGYYRATATRAPGEIFDTHDQAYLLPDGRALSFYVEVSGENTKDKYFQICADVNGNRGRSILGQDVFCFNINNFRKKITPAGVLGPGVLNSNTSINYLKDNCHLDQLGRSCGILLYKNNWKFPKDYPIKF